jgi:hypothetical protein
MIKVNLLRRVGRICRPVIALAGVGSTASDEHDRKPALRGLRRDFDDLTQTADLDHLRAEMNPLKRKHPLSSLETAAAPINDRSPRG